MPQYRGSNLPYGGVSITPVAHREEEYWRTVEDKLIPSKPSWQRPWHTFGNYPRLDVSNEDHVAGLLWVAHEGGRKRRWEWEWEWEWEWRENDGRFDRKTGGLYPPPVPSLRNHVVSNNTNRAPLSQSLAPLRPIEPSSCRGQGPLIANINQNSVFFALSCVFHSTLTVHWPIPYNTAHPYRGAGYSSLRLNTNFEQNKQTHHCLVPTLDQPKSQIFVQSIDRALGANRSFDVSKSW